MVIPCFFFFNDTATTEIYTLSLHDALPISSRYTTNSTAFGNSSQKIYSPASHTARRYLRSEEHTSELQSQSNLVCRLLLEKKKKTVISLPNILMQSTVLRVRISNPVSADVD